MSNTLLSVIDFDVRNLTELDFYFATEKKLSVFTQRKISAESCRHIQLNYGYGFPVS